MVPPSNCGSARDQAFGAISPTDLEFVPTSTREFFFLQAVLIFQENSGFPCKVFRNMKFTLLFGEFTHNLSPKSLLKFYIVISISTKRDQNHLH